jgi:cytosine/adenosine deaminase-related metal-dependent hydrolase
MKSLLAVAAFLLLAACQRSDVKVLIGATAVVAPGAQPIEDSVLVVEHGRIRSVGMRRDIPIPQDSERSDLTGKWVRPADGARIAVGERADILVLDRPDDAGANASKRLTGNEWR